MVLHISIKYLEKTLEVSKSLSSSISEFDAYIKYGNALQQVNRLYDALNCFENAKTVSESIESDTKEQELAAAKGIINIRIRIAENVCLPIVLQRSLLNRKSITRV